MHTQCILAISESFLMGRGCAQAAIKFYMDKSAFQKERELYDEAQLKSVMPATLAAEDNASGTIRTPYGYSFPPFVIIECGQSLDEWAKDNANKDFITVFQVCGPYGSLRVKYVQMQQGLWRMSLTFISAVRITAGKNMICVVSCLRPPRSW